MSPLLLDLLLRVLFLFHELLQHLVTATLLMLSQLVSTFCLFTQPCQLHIFHISIMIIDVYQYPSFEISRALKCERIHNVGRKANTEVMTAGTKANTASLARDFSIIELQNINIFFVLFSIIGTNTSKVEDREMRHTSRRLPTCGFITWIDCRQQLVWLHGVNVLASCSFRSRNDKTQDHLLLNCILDQAGFSGSSFYPLESRSSSHNLSLIT